MIRQVAASRLTVPPESMVFDSATLGRCVNSVLPAKIGYSAKATGYP